MSYINLPDKAFNPRQINHTSISYKTAFSIALSLIIITVTFSLGATFLGVVLIFVFLTIYMLLLVNYYQSQQINNRVKKHKVIAKANDFNYQPATQLIDGESILANLYKSQELQYVLSGYISNVSFTKAEFIHHYDDQHNTLNDTTTGTALIIYLPRQVPRIIIWSKLKINRDEHTNIYKKGGLKLEGPFGDNFNVSTAKNYERDALYILTPEIMHDIIALLPGSDIELVEDKVIIYLWGFKAIDKQDFIRLAEIVAVIGKEFLDNTKNYIDDKAVNRSKRSSQILKGETPDEPLVVHKDANKLSKNFLYIDDE